MARWTRKPPPGTQLDSLHPNCPNFCWPFLSPQGTPQLLTNGFKPSPLTAGDIYAASSKLVPGGKYGLSVRHGADTDIMKLGATAADANAIFGLSGGFTLMFAYRKNDVTLRASTVIGQNGNLTDATTVYMILPYIDNIIYWRYGGITNGVTALEVSAAGLTFGDDLWCFSTGPRGMEIWQNGILRGSNSANPSRSASTSYAAWPAGTPNWSDLADIALIMSWRRQLTHASIRELSTNPWQVFKPTSFREKLVLSVSVTPPPPPPPILLVPPQWQLQKFEVKPRPEERS